MYITFLDAIVVHIYLKNIKIAWETKPCFEWEWTLQLTIEWFLEKSKTYRKLSLTHVIIRDFKRTIFARYETGLKKTTFAFV